MHYTRTVPLLVSEKIIVIFSQEWWPSTPHTCKLSLFDTLVTNMIMTSVFKKVPLATSADWYQNICVRVLKCMNQFMHGYGK